MSANRRPAVGTQEWLDYHRKREQDNNTLMRLLGVVVAVGVAISLIVGLATGSLFSNGWADCVSGVFGAEHVGPFNGPSSTTMYDAQVKCGQGHGKVYSDLYTITLGPRDMAVAPSDQ